MMYTGPRSRVFIGLLALASALSPFGMVVVVPTLGEIGREYGLDYSEAQFMISAYLFGLGAAQPFSGFLCDRFGRRPVLLAGFAIFVVASFACAAVRGIEWLVLLRFFQAAGVSVGTVASRAIVRDTHDTEGTARVLSTIAAAMGISPVIGPVAGGFIGDAFGPQSVFVASALLGILVWAGIYRGLPETRPARTTATGLGGLGHDYRVLLGSRVFMGYTLMFGLVQGGFFAFLAVGAVVFEKDLGLGQKGFGLVWSFMAVAYVIGAAGAGVLGRSLGVARVLQLGVGLTAISGWALYALAVGPGISLWPLVFLLALLTAASGLVVPGSMAGAVSYRPEIAGTSSGLSSALGLVLSGGFTIVSGSIYTGDFGPVALLVAAAGTATAATAWMVRTQPDPGGQ